MTGTQDRPDTMLLANGEAVLFRPIRPTDAEALVAMHARLSADSIYRRYFGARPHLSPGDVDRFTKIAEDWRFALVAVAPSGALVGVTRYEGWPGSSSAELAIVVDDGYQRLGLGRALLLRLLDVARARGLTAIIADVLSSNAGMLGMLRSLDLPVTTLSRGEVIQLSIDLVRSA